MHIFLALCAIVKVFALTSNWQIGLFEVSVICQVQLFGFWSTKCQKEIDVFCALCGNIGLLTVLNFFSFFQGGNDYEIYIDERTKGHKVTSPDDTMNQLKELFSIS